MALHKFHPKLYGSCMFPQNLYSIKLEEISIFQAVWGQLLLEYIITGGGYFTC